MENSWLSVEEIAADLGIKVNTVYRWIQRRNMPAHKLGRLCRFQASEVDQWVPSRGVSQLASDANEEAE
jgi:excisionase family DNA binding protein